MKVSEKELIERLRKNHRCFAPAKKCAFFGFDSDVDLENKIYDFIDSNGTEWITVEDSWDSIVDFFLKEKIHNVSFSGQSGLLFHKLF